MKDLLGRGELADMVSDLWEQYLSVLAATNNRLREQIKADMIRDGYILCRGKKLKAYWRRGPKWKMPSLLDDIPEGVEIRFDHWQT